MISIRKLTFKDNKAWDSFVESSNNGTIFHKMSFLSYHPKNRFNFSFLGFYDHDELVAGIVGEVRNSIFKSPAGASYGSFVTKNLSHTQTEETLNSFLAYCKDNGIKEVFLTPPPLVYQKIIHQELDSLLFKKDFSMERALMTSIVDLSIFDQDIINLLDKKRRNQIRKSIKDGIKVKMSNDFDSFYPILVENKKKYKSLPTHTKNELYKIELLNPNKLKLFLAHKDNKPIAGVLVFVCNDNTVLIFYIAQDYMFQKYQPVSNLICEVLRWSRVNNYHYCDFGVNTDTSSSNPMDQVKSLIDFKESFNSRGFLRTTYHKIL